MKKYQEEIEELRRMLEDADGDDDEGSDSGGDDDADSDAGDVVIGGSQGVITDTSRQKSSPSKTNGQGSVAHGQASGPNTRKVGEM